MAESDRLTSTNEQLNREIKSVKENLGSTRIKHALHWKHKAMLKAENSKSYDKGKLKIITRN